jgi:hypothetical protein
MGVIRECYENGVTTDSYTFRNGNRSLIGGEVLQYINAYNIIEAIVPKRKGNGVSPDRD